MFGLSIEHILVLVVILLLFGPKRLPELGNSFGKAMRNFKDAINGVENAKFRKIPDTETANSAAESKDLLSQENNPQQASTEQAVNATTASTAAFQAESISPAAAKNNSPSAPIHPS